MLAFRNALLLLSSCFIACQVAVAESTGAIQSATAEIDRLVERSWDDRGIDPAEPSDDAEFCRRVWLDLAGVAPPVSEVRRFLANDDPAKRPILVDRLISSPQFASHLSSTWIATLLPKGANTNVRVDGRQQLRSWLRRQFVANKSYDRFVASLLAGDGQADSGPAAFYTTRELSPEKLAAATSRIFMGLQLQCAQCHDHPYDRWTQEDFWHYAAFFSQLEGTDPTPGRSESFTDQPGGEVTLPGSDVVVPPRYPGVSREPEPDPQNMRRRQLVIWLASRENPYLARAAVNRIWGQLFGRGLVDPVDAMDAGNLPSHPDLLEFLSDFLVQQDFDLRAVYAAIANSRAYGLSSALAEDRERPPADSFSVQAVKTLTAEQYFDSFEQNVLRAAGVSEPSIRERFLSRMQAPGASPVDYPHGVVQVLGLMNGPELQLATSTHVPGLLAALHSPWLDAQQQIETLFLATVSRYPTEAEIERVDQYLQPAGGKSSLNEKSLADLLWVLLNTAECAVTP